MISYSCIKLCACTYAVRVRVGLCPGEFGLVVSTFKKALWETTWYFLHVITISSNNCINLTNRIIPFISYVVYLFIVDEAQSTLSTDTALALVKPELLREGGKGHTWLRVLRGTKRTARPYYISIHNVKSAPVYWNSRTTGFKWTAFFCGNLGCFLTEVNIWGHAWIQWPGFIEHN